MSVTSENLSQRARSAKDCVHQGIERATEAAHTTADSAVESATKLAERAGRGADKLHEQREKVRARTISYANQHPVRAIVLSLGVGFVLAKLLKGRSSSV